MNVEQEIRALAAESIATQFVLTQVLSELSKLGPDFSRAIRNAFDDAANIAETTAIYLGKSAPPEQGVKAIRIVEELRAVVFRESGRASCHRHLALLGFSS